MHCSSAPCRSVTWPPLLPRRRMSVQNDAGLSAPADRAAGVPALRFGCTATKDPELGSARPLSGAIVRFNLTQVRPIHRLKVRSESPRAFGSTSSPSLSNSISLPPLSSPSLLPNSLPLPLPIPLPLPFLSHSPSLPPFPFSLAGVRLRKVVARAHSIPDPCVSPLHGGPHWQWRPFGADGIPPEPGGTTAVVAAAAAAAAAASPFGGSDRRVFPRRLPTAPARARPLRPQPSKTFSMSLARHD